MIDTTIVKISSMIRLPPARLTSMADNWMPRPVRDREPMIIPAQAVAMMTSSVPRAPEVNTLRSFSPLMRLSFWINAISRAATIE